MALDLIWISIPCLHSLPHLLPVHEAFFVIIPFRPIRSTVHIQFRALWFILKSLPRVIESVIELIGDALITHDVLIAF